MKKIKKYTGLLLIFFTLVSCNDFLTVLPEDSQTSDNYFNSNEKVRANTASLYGKVWWDFHNRFMFLAGDMMAGDMYYTYDQEGQFFFFSYNNGNMYVTEGWKGLYRVVSFANAVINDMPNLVTSNVSEEAVNKALGEAHFIRATAYYYLTEYWGEVPIIEKSTEMIVSGNLFVPKNTRRSCYDFMVNDLEFAEKYLPIEDSQKGRVTRWAAKAMLAKVYLTRAAAAMGDAATYGDASSYFAKAKTLCEDVIENSGRKLEKDFNNLFTWEGNNCDESLFAIQCMTGEYGVGNARNTNFARGSAIADQSWGEGKGPTIDLQKAFSDNDRRRIATYMRQGDYYAMLNKAGGGYTYNNLMEANGETPGQTLAHIKKYLIGKAADCENHVGLNQDAANNIHIIRLADVYLMYAEATLGTSKTTNDAKALEYFNEVHNVRAGLNAVSSLTFEDIMKERRLEFAFESLRWLDLKRYYYRDSQAALSLLNAQKRELTYYLIYGFNSGDPSDANNNANYEEIEPEAGYIQVYDSQMFLPIPAEALTGNPLLNNPAVEYEF